MLGLGAHRSGGVPGGGLDAGSCGHTRVLPAQQMFKKHLLGARLDERLRTQVSNAGPVLEKQLKGGRAMN